MKISPVVRVPRQTDEKIIGHLVREFPLSSQFG
jgi:hypothetical protein